MASVGALKALIAFVEGADAGALARIVEGMGTAADWESLGADALSAVAVAVPAAMPFAVIGELLLEVAPIALANFQGGDPDPIHDAQTSAGEDTHGLYAGR